MSLSPSSLIHRPSPKHPNSVPFSPKTPKDPQSGGRLSSSHLGLLLNSSIKNKSLKLGLQIHSYILRDELHRYIDLVPKIIKLYSLCGVVEYARQLFDYMSARERNVFLSTSMMFGFVENHLSDDALLLFLSMLSRGLQLDGFAISIMLKACGSLGSLQLVKQMHAMVVKHDLESFLSVANSLVYAYGCCLDIGRAERVFGGMTQRDIVSWSAIIQANSSCSEYLRMIELLYEMQIVGGLKPNEMTLVNVLPACGFLGSIRKGQAIHAYILRQRLEMNLALGSALVSLYCRCAHPDAAFLVFANMEERNVVVWTSMLEGFIINGCLDSGILLFQDMLKQGVKPNDVTIIVILSGCSHAGLVEYGWELFNSMKDKYGFAPQVEHYACMVDLLGRAGKFDEAEKLIETMPMAPTTNVLGAMLCACRLHSNAVVGERTARKIFELEPLNAANYVMLSNIYASCGRWEDVGKVRELMASKGLQKDPGCSWIDISGKVHAFVACDKSHSEWVVIYALVDSLFAQITDVGHKPCQYLVVDDVC